MGYFSNGIFPDFLPRLCAGSHVTFGWPSPSLTSRLITADVNLSSASALELITCTVSATFHSWVMRSLTPDPWLSLMKSCVFSCWSEAGSDMRSEFLTQPEPIVHPYFRAWAAKRAAVLLCCFRGCPLPGVAVFCQVHIFFSSRARETIRKFVQSQIRILG